MVALNKKIRASTLADALIAMLIISGSFVIAINIIKNVVVSNPIIIKEKALHVIDENISSVVERPVSQLIRSKGYEIKYEVSAPQASEVLIISAEAFFNKKTVIHKRYVYKKP